VWFFAPAAQANLGAYDAAMNYRLNCEGCHKADGSGQPGYVPDFRGQVARFLSIPDGRTYLASVPGTAQSLLTDEERADVLNWIVRTFDPSHLPPDFQPYTAGEVAQWRFNAQSRPGLVRTNLLAQLDRSGAAAVTDVASAGHAPATKQVEQPAAFAICAACHTVSSDGAPGIGPNLHGVVGRQAGTAPGFGYSPAMKAAGFKWTREALDEYLTSPGAKVPGNYMMYMGLPDAGERRAIVDYLEGLR
jgi:cytochrome c